MRRSEEHLNRVTDLLFGPKMRKAFPVLRGYKEKLRQGKSPIKPAPFEVVEAKREERKVKPVYRGSRRRRGHGRPRGR